MPDFRVTIIERRELSFDIWAEDADQARQMAEGLQSSESIYDELLDPEIRIEQTSD